MSQKLHLPRALVNRMLAHAQQNPEQEICGLISIANDQRQDYHPIENCADDKAQRYEMNPEQLVNALRNMRERGETLFAIVHSHPHSPAQASRLDIDQAQYPDAYYLIISLNTRGVLEMRAYRINEGASEELKVTI